MKYKAYLQQINKAANATGGKVVSLAGCYFGVQLVADGANVVLALDLDSDKAGPPGAKTSAASGAATRELFGALQVRLRVCIAHVGQRHPKKKLI